MCFYVILNLCRCVIAVLSRSLASQNMSLHEITVLCCGILCDNMNMKYKNSNHSWIRWKIIVSLCAAQGVQRWWRKGIARYRFSHWFGPTCMVCPSTIVWRTSHHVCRNQKYSAMHISKSILESPHVSSGLGRLVSLWRIFIFARWYEFWIKYVCTYVCNLLYRSSIVYIASWQVYTKNIQIHWNYINVLWG